MTIKGVKKHPLAQKYTDKGKREHNTKLQLQLHQRKFLGVFSPPVCWSFCYAIYLSRKLAPWLLWTALPPTSQSVQDVAAEEKCWKVS